MRYLIRSKMPFFKTVDVKDIVGKDLIGTNTGNLLFPYSIIRLLKTSEDIFDTYAAANPNDAEQINENYDMFLIPLANAFRDNFIEELENMTALIKRLTIPCIVIGVGASFSYEPNIYTQHKFDDATKAFCKAVLDKSSRIGVRGGVYI